MRADDQGVPFLKACQVFDRMHAFLREFTDNLLIVDDVAIGVDGSAFRCALFGHLDRATHAKAKSAIFC